MTIVGEIANLNDDERHRQFQKEQSQAPPVPL
jgi:hypothetical protein